MVFRYYQQKYPTLTEDTGSIPNSAKAGILLQNHRVLLDFNEGIIDKWDEIVGLDVNKGIKLGYADGITLDLDDRRNIGSLFGSFYGSYDGKLEVFSSTTDGCVVGPIKIS